VERCPMQINVPAMVGELRNRLVCGHQTQEEESRAASIASNQELVV
jgi:L-lactate utilization protein LutB